MSIQPSWIQIALRLGLTLIAGAILGMNREEQRRPAGFRTTILVSLASCIAMIQTNLLMGTIGKTQDSFVVLDLMRLPLGILSGMGFIGAGAILRRENSVRGVTTAATLWFATVMGLCLGGGQIGLGLTSLALGFTTLRGLKWIEVKFPRDHHAICILLIECTDLSEESIRQEFAQHRLHISSCSRMSLPEQRLREFQYEVHWRSAVLDSKIPPLYEKLTAYPGVKKVEWRSQSY